jgi:thymidylate synthase
MKDGFPLLTTKKVAFQTMVTELLWFLRGDTNIKYLVDNDCNIWNGDAYKNYLKGGDVKWLKSTEVDTPIGKMSIPIPYSQEEFINQIKTDDEFAEKWGDLGPIYGKQWRSWGEEKQMDLDTSTVLRVENGIEKHPYKEFISKQGIDQIQNLINNLKTNPDSRRLMVNAWNVGELDQMVLPPCHYGFQCYVREGKYLSLMWNQRSVDTFLGLPFNIASYGLLLTILAKEVNMVPDELIGNLGDVHLYLNHIEQAKEQIGREPFELPTLNQFPTYEGSRPSIESYVVSDFTLKDYQSHPSIKAPLSN